MLHAADDAEAVEGDAVVVPGNLYIHKYIYNILHLNYMYAHTHNYVVRVPSGTLTCFTCHENVLLQMAADNLEFLH